MANKLNVDDGRTRGNFHQVLSSNESAKLTTESSNHDKTMNPKATEEILTTTYTLQHEDLPKVQHD
ncbi:hypothetical protein MKW94_024191 [Papaver nudicaule]|uniref:Uncharacterized protein n=1 Tax=Papaver nudicaule TaxID=74823 RepID=A0AA41S585_PAPNU|nr:hypothetical protein [Papaver nudicaule]